MCRVGDLLLGLILDVILLAAPIKKVLKCSAKSVGFVISLSLLRIENLTFFSSELF